MFKSIGSTWILNLFQIVVLMRLTPFVLHTLGDDQNGLWIVIVSLTGFLSLLILGIPMASVRYIAEAVARQDVQRTNTAISTCLGICGGLGIGALLVGAVLYPFFAAEYAAHATTPEMAEAARLAFLLVVAQVSLGFVMRLPYGIFDAHHDFVVRNGIMAGELVLRFGLTMALLSWKASLVMLAWVQIGCMVTEFTVALLVIRKRYPGVRFGLAHFDRVLVRSILSFSIFAMLLNVGTLLAFRSDALVIGSFLGAAQVTEFDMGNKFFDPLTNLLIAVAGVVMPMATRLKTTGDLRELRDVFLKWSKISLSIVLLIGLYLLMLGPEFLGWWVGPEFAEPSGRVLQILMVSFLVYLPVRGVALPVLMGLGKPAFPALALLGMGIVNLIASLVLVRSYGIAGVAIGTAVPNVLFAVAVLWRTCRELDLPIGEYARYVIARPLIGALVPLAFLAALKWSFDVHGFVALVLAGIGMVATFAVCWVFFVYRGDPYMDLALRLSARGRAAPRNVP